MAGASSLCGGRWLSFRADDDPGAVPTESGCGDVAKAAAQQAPASLVWERLAPVDDALPQDWGVGLIYRPDQAQGKWVIREADLSANAPPLPADVVIKPQAQATHRVETKLRRRQRRQAGTFDCQVDVVVGRDGLPVIATAQSCPETFREIAESAAMKWRFAPYEIDGTTFRFRCVVNFEFVIDG